MSNVIEILRLKYDARLSHQKIAQALGLSKGAVSKYVSMASAAGVAQWPLPDGYDESALEKLLHPESEKKPSRYIEPDWFTVHQELKNKGVTLLRLWAEHEERVGDKAHRYTQFSQHYRRWKQDQKRSLRQHHRSGEKVFIDHCGPTVSVVDRRTGKVREAQIFVAVLGASSYTFAEATWTQGLEDWIGSNRRMLEYFGGVPELLVPDNLKSATTKACRYEPVTNATYLEFARHYGTAVFLSVCCWFSLMPNVSKDALNHAKISLSNWIVPHCVPYRRPPTSTRSGVKRKWLLITMFNLTAVTTASHTHWWGTGWIYVQRWTLSKYSAAASALAAIRAMDQSASTPCQNTYLRRIDAMHSGHRRASTSGLSR